jgi:hypothetical protein
MKKPTGKKAKHEDNPYSGLRGKIFTVTPEEIGLTATKDEKVFAVVMDMGIDDSTATLVSIIDGNASMYLSSGGGIIGGSAHENVKAASIAFVKMGQTYLSKMAQVDSFPLPEPDYVRFYLLTNKGKYSVEESMEKIDDEKSDWSELFYEGNNVLAELRSISEQDS